MRSRGFTLMELLVVIVIIGGLLGILLPVLPGVRDAAQRTGCLANLRSIGQGMRMHLDENRETFPKARYMPNPWLSGDDDPPLNVVLNPFIDWDSEAWICPGDMIVHATEYTEDGELRTGGVSYFYRSIMSGRQYTDTHFHKRLRLSPSELSIVSDYDGGTFETQDGREITAGFFHAQRAILFADLHAGDPPKQRKPEDESNI